MKTALALLLLLSAPKVAKKAAGSFPEIQALQSQCAPVKYPFRLDSMAYFALAANVSACNLGEHYRYVMIKVGFPDEIHFTYSGKKSRRATGFSFVYLIQRKKPRGSARDRQEKSFRLDFGSNLKLRKINHIGFASRAKPRK